MGPIPAGQPRRRPLRHKDRPVAPAGAAEGDGEVAFAFGPVARQQKVQHADEAVEEGPEIRIGGDVVARLRVQPRGRPQAFDIMRIAQETDVEDQVCMARHAVAIAEALHEHRQFAPAVGREVILNAPAQRVDGFVGCVDHRVGQPAQRCDHVPFQPHAVQHRPFARQRMAPAGLGIALHQDIVGAIQEHQPGIDIAARQNAAHRGFHRRRVEVPRPHIDPQRQRPVALAAAPAAESDEPVEHGERQIVDDREADILKGRQRGRFAGARKAGDQRQQARPGRLIGLRRLSSIVGRHDHGPKRYTQPALSLRDGAGPGA